MRKAITAVGLLPLVMSAAPAFAQSEPFEGVSATIVGGVDSSGIIGDETGFLYAGQIGYDLRSSNVVFGAEAEVGGATTDGGCLSPGLCAKAGRDLYAGVRVGIVASESTLLYVKGGYTNARQTFSYTPPQPPVVPQPVVPKNATAEGWRVGVGIEQLISDNIHLKAEYRYSDYDSGNGRHQGVVGIGFRF